MFLIKTNFLEITSKNSIFLLWNLLQKKHYIYNFNKLTSTINKYKLFFVRSDFVLQLLLKSYKFFFIKNLLNFVFFNFRFILFSGLGYKKKILKKHKLIFTYIADRHWILIKLNNNQTIFPIKKRNFIIISKKKSDFNKLYSFFSSLKSPYIYKMKGFIDNRVKQRFLFVRRIKIKGIKTKLSKKQMML